MIDTNAEDIKNAEYIKKKILSGLDKLQAKDKEGYYRINLEMIELFKTDIQVLQSLQQHYHAFNDHKCLTYLLHKLNKAQPNTQSVLSSLVIHQLMSGDKENIAPYLDQLTNSTIEHESTTLLSVAKYAQKNTNFDNAIRLYQMLAQKGANKDEATFYLASVFIEQKQAKKAKLLYKALLSKDSGNPQVLFNLATLEEELGHKEAAISLYMDLISKEPNFIQAQSRYLYLKDDIKATDKVLLIALNTVGSSTLTEAEIQLCFALGKVYDQNKHYKQAVYFYHKANKALNYNFDKDLWQRSITAIQKNYQTVIENKISSDNPERPIFITGLFRSGSTLVEQILSSHSTVSSLGEVDYFKQAIGISDFSLASIEGQLGNTDHLAIREAYLSKLAEHGQGVDFVTNKNMENWLLIGHIIKAFPQARIIYTSRSIRDNALAIYFQHLSTDQPYAAKMEDIFFYIEQQQKLMDFWLMKFPDNIYEVKYESIVNDMDGEVNRLLAFLDLPMESNCLQFHNNKNQVNTASIWQVRKPLYKSSVKRWENYQKYLSTA